MYSASSHCWTEIVNTCPAHMSEQMCTIHILHKVVQNVPCTMLHSQNPFLYIFPLGPAHFGASTSSTGQCLGIVLILSLMFSCRFPIRLAILLPSRGWLSYAGARGNIKLAKFTYSRSTTVSSAINFIDGLQYSYIQLSKFKNSWEIYGQLILKLWVDCNSKVMGRCKIM